MEELNFAAKLYVFKNLYLPAGVMILFLLFAGVYLYKIKKHIKNSIKKHKEECGCSDSDITTRLTNDLFTNKLEHKPYCKKCNSVIY